MASESDSNLRLEIGHVLFVDLVGYSKLLIDEQSERSRQLTDIVLATAQVDKSTNNGLVRLPTGDGMALVFRNNSEEPAQCAIEIARALKAHPEIQVRMGVHSGPVSEVADLNGRTNITGAGINLAQRVMDCGDAGHILLSQRVAEDLRQYRQWSPRLHELGECEVKHGIKLCLANLCGGDFGNAALPAKLAGAIARPKATGKLQIGLAFAAVLLVAAGVIFFRFKSGVKSPQIASAALKSIAVLPFENRSEDKANAFFADGIQDEILTRLAKIGDLKVISRTSTQRYKSSPENLAEIAKQLGVAHVLEGSVQKLGDQVRVTVQLIRGVSDSHVWAETYDRKLTDIFAVESEIAETIARSLQAKLTPLEQRTMAAKPTENPAAYEEYLHGRALWNRATSLPEDGDEMIRHFSRAVELDPKFALGWAFLSVAHSHKYAQFDDSVSKVQAKEALDRAFSLEPDLGEAYLADGIYRYRILRDSDQALASFQKARDRAANRALAVEYSSYVKRRQGKWDEALQLHAESLDLDPRNPHLLAEVANTYHALRRFDEAQSLIDRAREIEPENAQLLARKAYMLLEAGDSATAGRLFEGVRIDGADPLVTMIHVRYWIVTRQFSDAIRALKSVIEGPENLPELRALTAVCYRAELAVAEALAGNPEARAGLDRARDELTAIRAHGRVLWSSRLLLVISGFVQDKATVDAVAAQLREKFQNDAIAGPGMEEVIAKARAHLGETDAALQSVKHLLQTSSGNPLTPALLRTDPLWDPLRNDPRFQKLVEVKP
jgi:TolB-like protein/Flp pilus assembly protein TadD